jgi:hypothetical protein
MLIYVKKLVALLTNISEVLWCIFLSPKSKSRKLVPKRKETTGRVIRHGITSNKVE